MKAQRCGGTLRRYFFGAFGVWMNRCGVFTRFLAGAVVTLVLALALDPNRIALFLFHVGAPSLPVDIPFVLDGALMGTGDYHAPFHGHARFGDGLTAGFNDADYFAHGK